MLKGIEKNDVESIVKSTANYEELCKLAIAYSDGVIQNSEKANENVMKFARESGVPVLDYQPAETLSLIHIYPRISPAIIVFIRRGDSILRVHARNFRGTFNGLVAGFLEPGETLEECVIQ